MQYLLRGTGLRAGGVAGGLTGEEMEIPLLKVVWPVPELPGWSSGKVSLMPLLSVLPGVGTRLDCPALSW